MEKQDLFIKSMYNFSIQTIQNILEHIIALKKESSHLVHLQELLEKIEKAIITLKDDFINENRELMSDSSDFNSITIHENIISLYIPIQEISSFLKIIENHIKSNFHPSIIYLTRDLVKDFNSSTEILLNTIPELNYAEAHLPGKIKKLLDLDNDYLLIQIPAIFKDDILHSCVLAHEVGHFLDFNNSLKAEIIQDKKINEILNQKINPDVVKQIESERKDSFEKNLISIQRKGNKNLDEFLSSFNVLTDIKKIFEKWVNEIIADLFGTYILSFAFYFSAIIFALESSKDGADSETHPPHALRIKYMNSIILEPFYSTIEDCEIKNKIKELIENDISKINLKEELPKTHVSKITNLLEEVFKDSLEIIKPIIISHFSKLNVKKQFNIKEIEQLLECLNNSVPPCEYFLQNLSNFTGIGVPSDSYSILNSSWLFTLLHPMSANSKIQNLVLKAIEQSYIKRKFIENQE